MKCVILQPSYIPWRGYFHQIQKADTFIFLDDVQYDRRGWRNRNRIKTATGAQRLSIPVLNKNSIVEGTPINRIRIDPTRLSWREKHRRALEQSYRKAPYFERYRQLLNAFYAAEYEFLADFTVDLTIALAGELRIENTKFLRSSDFAVAGRKTDRLLSLLEAVGATHYITGGAARAYLEEEKFAANGIALEYMNYDYPEYPQLYPPFDSQVSILDLLFMTGNEAGKFIWAA